MSKNPLKILMPSSDSSSEDEEEIIGQEDPELMSAEKPLSDYQLRIFFSRTSTESFFINLDAISLKRWLNRFNLISAGHYDELSSSDIFNLYKSAVNQICLDSNIIVDINPECASVILAILDEIYYRKSSKYRSLITEFSLEGIKRSMIEIVEEIKAAGAQNRKREKNRKIYAKRHQKKRQEREDPFADIELPNKIVKNEEENPFDNALVRLEKEKESFLDLVEWYKS